jgi:DNA-binding transcriptional ArsR family regulator
MTEFDFNRNYLLQLTNEVYRITLLFPKKEPLRYKMREVSNEILANFISLSEEDNTRRKISLAKKSHNKIKILDSFLNIARSQGWVRNSDLLSLQEEYGGLKDKIDNVDVIVGKVEEVNEVDAGEAAHVPITEVRESDILHEEEIDEKGISLSGRQEKILKILKKKERAQVHEMKNYFPDISKRTLRRDLKELLENALIERKGKRSNTFYKIRHI